MPSPYTQALCCCNHHSFTCSSDFTAHSDLFHHILNFWIYESHGPSCQVTLGDPQQGIYRHTTTKTHTNREHQHPPSHSKTTSFCVRAVEHRTQLRSPEQPDGQRCITEFLTRSSTVDSCDSTSACWLY